MEAKDRPPPIENPQTLICPPSNGDLEYALYKIMESARFQEWHGNMSWRRRQDGPFHFRSLETATYVHIEFKTFRTSAGTQLILEPWWQTSKYEFGVEQKDLLQGFQDLLDGIQTIFPCSN